jgi:hypothetical protein
MVNLFSNFQHAPPALAYAPELDAHPRYAGEVVVNAPRRAQSVLR